MILILCIIQGLENCIIFVILTSGHFLQLNDLSDFIFVAFGENVSSWCSWNTHFFPRAVNWLATPLSTSLSKHVRVETTTSSKHARGGQPELWRAGTLGPLLYAYEPSISAYLPIKNLTEGMTTQRLCLNPEHLLEGCFLTLTFWKIKLCPLQQPWLFDRLIRDCTFLLT